MVSSESGAADWLAGEKPYPGDHLEHAEQLRPVLALPASAVHKGQVGQAPPTQRGATSAAEAARMLIDPQRQLSITLGS